ncbi:MAG: hypothetical protein ACI4F4_07470 [Lachnospiraceae bacterium]
MFCSNCGKENLETAAFCCDCGSPLKSSDTNVETTKKIAYGEINSSNDIKCPSCGGFNVNRENRMGCLGCFGHIILGIISILVVIFVGVLIIGLLPIEDKDAAIAGLEKLLLVCFVIDLIVKTFTVLVNMTKPKWTWDMTCEDCKTKFEWDTSTKRVKKE